MDQRKLLSHRLHRNKMLILTHKRRRGRTGLPPGFLASSRCFYSLDTHFSVNVMKHIQHAEAGKASCHASKDLTMFAHLICCLMPVAHFPKTLTIGNGYNFFMHFFFSCKESELDLCALPGIVSNCYVLNILIYLDHWGFLFVVCYTIRETFENVFIF